MDILDKMELAPIHSFKEMIVIASPCITMKMKGRTKIDSMLQDNIHFHRPQTRPNIKAMLCSIKELGVKLLRYIKVINQEYIMIQKHEILGTAILDILIEKVITSNTMRIAAIALGQKLLLRQLDITYRMFLANSKYLSRTFFICRIIKYRISKWILEELSQSSYLIFYHF